MQIIVVQAHPLGTSLCASLAQRCVTRLRAAGHDVYLRDLYGEGFDPVLSAQERAGYYTRDFEDRAGLREAEALILVFPTWWFGLPAILKGWIDRSFLPGVAYDHADDLSALRPRLDRLRHVICITTLGSPAWIDWLVLRRPVARALKWGLVKACAPGARYAHLSLYRAERVAPDRLTRFEARIDKILTTHLGDKS
ncbi:NAD(P)H-dependent oxidoreductase [Primorskyibacter sp. S187A]|uniref:NAD(P)H-dependent oxidoreductase n=1 Tax=Primorskyibacter sp. S187A TaxID=3415130 RepID=UPI003C7E77D3